MGRERWAACGCGRCGIAGRNYRSLNSEILVRLTASDREEPVDAETLLARIRRRREGIGEVDVREETLRILRDAGRP